MDKNITLRVIGKYDGKTCYEDIRHFNPDVVEQISTSRRNIIKKFENMGYKRPMVIFSEKEMDSQSLKQVDNDLLSRLSAIICMLLISIGMFAQATDLVIDNQTPGWLSSKINYSDQMTVRNLKVTGYLNATDITFIGSLIQDRKLNGRVDLSEVNMVGQGDNIFKGEWWNASGTLNFFAPPMSCTDVIECCSFADTLYYNCRTSGCKMSNITSTAGYLPKHLIIGDNIDSIPNNAFSCSNLDNSRLESVELSPNVKYIGSLAFSLGSSKLKINFQVLNNLKYLGAFAFINISRNYSTSAGRKPYSYYGGTYQPDTLIVPESLTELYPSFVLKDGQHVFLGKNIQSIIGGNHVYSDKRNASFEVTTSFWNSEGHVYIHMKSPIPPEGASPSDSYTVYIPHGSLDAYQNSEWKNANLVEEVLANSVTLDTHTLSLDKNQSYDLHVDIQPENADEKTMFWFSTHDSVATVNKNGYVTAHAPGQTTIYVRSVVSNVCDSCLVTVIQHAEDIIMDTSTVVFSSLGEKKSLSVTFIPTSTTDKGIIWASSNSSVCMVTNSGELVAVGYGQAVITAVSNDGNHVATCVVTVNDPGVVHQDVNQDGTVDTQDVLEIYDYMQKN